MALTVTFALLAGLLISSGLSSLDAPPATAATTALSTVTKSGTNATNGSTASSSGVTGTASPGDTIKWAVNYANNSTANATVNIADPITSGQTYVNGSLVVPPALTRQYSTNGGTSWTAGTPPAGSTGVGATGTLSPGNEGVSPGFSSSTAISNTAGGDGWSVLGFAGNIYTIYHHSTDSTTVFCATLTNQVCPGWPAKSTYVSAVTGTLLGTGTVGAYATASLNGSLIVNGLLYWPVEATAPVGGVYPVGMQCLNLSTLLSCGFTQLDTVPTSPLLPGPGVSAALISGDGIAATNGKYYYLDTKGNMLCFLPGTGSCGTFPVGSALPISTVTDRFAITGTYGSLIFATMVNASATTEGFTCFNTATNSVCTGYPIASVGASELTGCCREAGEVLPVLSATGTVLGACSVFNSVCFSTSGVSIPNPYTAQAFGFQPVALGGGLGQGYATGSKYYTIIGANTVGCFDFALRVGTGAVPACAGFSGPSNTNGYTVRPLANLPGCMSSDGDAGQVRIFNALTGGPCVSATSARTMSAPSYCDGQSHSGNWTTLTLNGLTGAEYGAATVTLSGSAGPIAGFTNLQLAPGQTSVNISSIPMSGTTAGLTATVNFTGVTNSAAVNAATFSLKRAGDTYSQVCYQTTVNPVTCGTISTVSDNATAVTTVAATTDGPAGNSSGLVSFTVPLTDAQCMLAISKSSGQQRANPGDTVTYSIQVTNTGTVNYGAASPASFTDSLTNVLTDATYDGNATASAGTVSYSEPVVSWSGPLAAGATATITYTVTVNNPDQGPHSLVNTVVSTNPSNCQTGSTDPKCTVPVDVSAQWTLKKEASVGGNLSDGTSVNPGETITYTVTATATSPGDKIDGIVLTDDLSRVLNNASFVTGSAVLVIGGAAPVAVADPVAPATTLATTTFTLTAGQVATLQYKVLVNSNAWSKELINVVTGTSSTLDPLSCFTGATAVAPECTTTHITPAKFLIEKIGESSNSAWVPMDGSSWAVLDDANGASGTANAAYQVVAVSGETGRFQVEGIPSGTYWLEETAAPAGFNLLAEPVQFTVAADGVIALGQGEGGGVVTTADVDADGVFLVTVRDVPALKVPESGSTGSWPFALGGSVLLLLSVLLASVSIIRRRNQPTR